MHDGHIYSMMQVWTGDRLIQSIVSTRHLDLSNRVIQLAFCKHTARFIIRNRATISIALASERLIYTFPPVPS